MVGILREANPHWISTADGWRHHVEHLPERAERRIWVAVEADAVIGVSMASRHAFTSEPGVAWVSATVRADRRRQGIGAQLYALAEEHAIALGSRRLLSWLVDMPDGLQFARGRGFTPERSGVYSRVDPRNVDVSRLDALPAGVRVAPLSELRERLEDVFATLAEAVLDEPATVPADELRFDEWLDEIRNPLTTWEGTFCTLDGDEVVAVAEIYADLESGSARNGFTGTRRDYRGRGHASAAKLASIRWLAANGVTELWTGNDDANTPMLAINHRLGYRPALRHVEIVREL